MHVLHLQNCQTVLITFGTGGGLHQKLSSEFNFRSYLSYIIILYKALIKV